MQISGNIDDCKELLLESDRAVICCALLFNLLREELEAHEGSVISRERHNDKKVNGISTS